MSENIPPYLVTLDDVTFHYKSRTKFGDTWFYVAKLSYKSFVELWQACDSLEQFQASYEAMGGGSCHTLKESDPVNPEVSVHKIKFTAGVLRNRGVELKTYDMDKDLDHEKWEDLRNLARKANFKSAQKFR